MTLAHEIDPSGNATGIAIIDTLTTGILFCNRTVAINDRRMQTIWLGCIFDGVTGMDLA